MQYEYQCYQWDQRIPNEPILDRQYIFSQPPTVLLDRAVNTDECSDTDNTRPLLYTSQQEKQAEVYWRTMHGTPPTLPVRQKGGKHEKPWIHGVHKNIDRDSELRYPGYNPNDIISSGAQKKLDRLNHLSDQRLTGKFDFRAPGKLWHNVTSPRMSEHRSR